MSQTGCRGKDEGITKSGGIHIQSKGTSRKSENRKIEKVNQRLNDVPDGVGCVMGFNEFSNIDPDLNIYNGSQRITPLLTPQEIQQTLLDFSFSIIHLNCRSIVNKMNDLRILTNYLQPHIIGVTETWLKLNDENLINLQGYTFLHIARKTGRGGGVGIFISNVFEYSTVRFSSVVSTFEFMLIKIKCKNKTYLLCVVYRPPCSDTKLFISEFADLMSEITVLSNSLFVFGDFNIDYLTSTSNSYSHHFYSTMYSYHLYPTIF